MLQRIIKFGVSAMPLFIIGFLLYAALFIKPKPTPSKVVDYAINERDRFYGVAVPCPSVIWAVGCHGKIIRSDDAGESWVVQPTPVRVHLQGIAAWDERRAVVAGNDGVVIITSDGGKSWEKVDVPVSEVANKFLRVKIFDDSDRVWAVGEMGAVLYSEDFGSTWARAMEEEDQGWNDISFVGEQGWLVGEFGRIMATNDGGATWTSQTNPMATETGDMGEVGEVETSLMAVAFRDKTHGVITGLDGIILVTEDGGSHWIEAPKVTREHLFDVIWDGSAWVSVGDKGTLLTGDPSGMIWDVSRTAELDMSWYTEIRKTENRYYLAGDYLAVLEKGVLTIFGRNTANKGGV